MRLLSSLVLICTLAAAEGDGPTLRFGTIRVEETRVVGTLLQEGEPVGRSVQLRIATEAGVKTCDAPTDGCDLVVNSRLVALIAYLQRLGKVPEGEALAAATEEAGR